MGWIVSKLEGSRISESSWTKKGRAAPGWQPKLKAVKVVNKDMQEVNGLNIELCTRLYQSGAEQH